MHYADLNLEIYPAGSISAVPVEFDITDEKTNEYLIVSLGGYCMLYFRITELTNCSIWHTRFLINEKLTLRVSGDTACTFLWVGWKNTIHYAIKGAPLKTMRNDYYNLYHLSEVAWDLHFPEPGEYETFNVLFNGLDLPNLGTKTVSPELSRFLGKSRQNETVFLYPSHRRLNSGLGRTISDLVRGPIELVNRQEYYQDKITDLLFGLIRELSKPKPVLNTSLHPRETEQLCALRDRIIEHPEKEYHVQDLARKAGMNEKKLQYGFKQLFNTTVFGFIHRQRMQLARRLLRENACTVKEVTAMTGYKNPSNFSAAFINYFGYPPSRAAKE